MVKFITYDAAIYRLSPALEKTLRKYLPKHVRDGMQNHVTQSRAKILARMDRKPERKDLCSYIFEVRDEMDLTIWDMTGYSNAVIIAGSETSATVLSALTHWLCKTPDVYEKLKKEVRSRFKSSYEITSQSATFPYLTAVINEILRVFPPLPNGPPRIAPEGGEIVAGVYVPEGVSMPFSYPWSVINNFYLDNRRCPHVVCHSQLQLFPRSRHLQARAVVRPRLY
jgi:cytochrome P450